MAAWQKAVETLEKSIVTHFPLEWAQTRSAATIVVAVPSVVDQHLFAISTHTLLVELVVAFVVERATHSKVVAV